MKSVKSMCMQESSEIQRRGDGLTVEWTTGS